MPPELSCARRVEIDMQLDGLPEKVLLGPRLFSPRRPCGGGVISTRGCRRSQERAVSRRGHLLCAWARPPLDAGAKSQGSGQPHGPRRRRRLCRQLRLPARSEFRVHRAAHAALVSGRASSTISFHGPATSARCAWRADPSSRLCCSASSSSTTSIGQTPLSSSRARARQSRSRRRSSCSASSRTLRGRPTYVEASRPRQRRRSEIARLSSTMCAA